MQVKLDRDAIVGLVATSVGASGYFIVRLVTSQATGTFDAIFVLFTLQMAVWGAMIIGPLMVKHPLARVLLLTGINALVSVPVHYRVFAFPTRVAFPLFQVADIIAMIFEVVFYTTFIAGLWNSHVKVLQESTASA